MTSGRRARFAVGMTAAALAVAACADDAARPVPAPTSVPAASSPAGTPASSLGTAGTSDLAERSGDEVFAASREAMMALDSVRYELRYASPEETSTFDVRTSGGGECRGTLGLGAGTIEILTSGGGEWFRPDPAVWRSLEPEHADEILAAAGDRWVVDEGWEYANFCDLRSFLAEMFDNDDGDEFTVLGQESLDGEQVVRIRSVDADDVESVGFVRSSGEPYTVRIEIRGGDREGEIAFSQFDEPVTAERPPASDVVDLSQFL